MPVFALEVHRGSIPGAPGATPAALATPMSVSPVTVAIEIGDASANR